MNRSARPDEHTGILKASPMMRAVIALFIMALGFQFFAFMQLVKMYTGIELMPFVCLISPA